MEVGGGGAIYAAGSTLAITGSTFSHNQAPKEKGGAIFASGGTLAVTGSEFYGNRDVKGAIATGLLTTTSVTLLNVTFRGNVEGQSHRPVRSSRDRR